MIYECGNDFASHREEVFAATKTISYEGLTSMISSNHPENGWDIELKSLKLKPLDIHRALGCLIIPEFIGSLWMTVREENLMG